MIANAKAQKDEADILCQAENEASRDRISPHYPRHNNK